MPLYLINYPHSFNILSVIYYNTFLKLLLLWLFYFRRWTCLEFQKPLNSCLKIKQIKFNLMNIKILCTHILWFCFESFFRVLYLKHNQFISNKLFIVINYTILYWWCECEKKTYFKLIFYDSWLLIFIKYFMIHSRKCLVIMYNFIWYHKICQSHQRLVFEVGIKLFS
jgi:hypothetical protein